MKNKYQIPRANEAAKLQIKLGKVLTKEMDGETN